MIFNYNHENDFRLIRLKLVVLYMFQVNATTCLSIADVGSKTVAGAKEIIPGTKLCLQPDIDVSMHPERHNFFRGKGSRNPPAPLLEGLPDDLAMACLIRVPRVDHRSLRLVSKGWYRLLAGNFFYSLRKSSGTAEQWVYVIRRDRNETLSWHAFDPLSRTWQPLPPIPEVYSEAIGYGCAVLSGCNLYLFGGKHPLKGSMKSVVFYSARTNKWHRAPDMLHRRHFFGVCVFNNCLYVAGGENEAGMRYALSSAEVFDPNKNRWSKISDMSMPMLPFSNVIHDGKWYIKGLGQQRQLLSEVYDLKSDSWSPVYNGIVGSWSYPSASLNGKLYSLDCIDGCKLRVYDEARDWWRKHIDSGVHRGDSKALEAAAVVLLNGKLCIVRNNMSISLVDVSRYENAGSAESSEDVWETIAKRGQFKTVMSNIRSRRRGKSQILHCQVLQA